MFLKSSKSASPVTTVPSLFSSLPRVTTLILWRFIASARDQARVTSTRRRAVDRRRIGKTKSHSRSPGPSPRSNRSRRTTKLDAAGTTSSATYSRHVQCRGEPFEFLGENSKRTYRKTTRGRDFAASSGPTVHGPGAVISTPLPCRAKIKRDNRGHVVEFSTLIPTIRYPARPA